MLQLAAMYAEPIYDAFKSVRQSVGIVKEDTLSDSSLRRLITQPLLEVMQPRDVVGLPQMSNSSSDYLKSLSKALKGTENSSVITCGGSVSLEELTTPLCLRFDDNESGPRKLLFGVATSSHAVSSAEIRDLITQCQPATFGLQGHDVLDKEYRDALKMEPGQFSMNFHPFDHGILDTITRLLLPQSSIGELKVEFYKLNIYGPGGQIQVSR